MHWVVSTHRLVHPASICLRFAGLTPKTTAVDTPVVPITPAEPSPIVLANAQATLNNQLITLYASLPSRTAFIIFTGHS